MNTDEKKHIFKVFTVQYMEIVVNFDTRSRPFEQTYVALPIEAPYEIWF